ncbi:hypothetical protein [uncultured Polaribacter sp.]|uniref:hypothetical protein n=1 Tax=uncultured Polaribacter sp. TaxID=174711 RepID=UPI00262EC0C6|nr:hypothetical protein [uncultured Polaribacter sp.]
MKKKQFISIEIDKLTNSIENRITGDSFDTQVLKIEETDLKLLDRNWNFDWKLEFENSGTVYKLIIEENYKVIQGLISLKYKEGFVFVELIENADFNIGRNKVYYGVAGNLFAFACKQSWDKGDFGYVAFNAKSNLVSHYENFLGAKRVGNSNQMIIEPKEALKLIKQYYKV